MNHWSVACVAAAGCLALPAIAGSGRIIAIGDEWMLSDAAFAAQAQQTTQLTDNISLFFTDNLPSRLLVLSESPPVFLGQRGVLGTALKNRMEALGHSWEVNPVLPFNLQSLRNYRAIFFSGGASTVNMNVLESYVREGGNVLVMVGTGDWGSAGAEASAWNAFVTRFGLSFGDTWFALGGNLLNVPTLPSGNPLGKLITNVQWGYGQTVNKLQADNPLVEIAVYGDFAGFSPLLPSGPVQPIIGTVNITTKCIGDLNNDGFVDDSDFVLFVQAYNLLLCEDPAMAAGCPSDFNRDGFVDDVDFTIFIQTYDLPVCL
ncbi:MAG: dockerin type I domain-containing protein [Phycisphaerales bacterium]